MVTGVRVSRDVGRPLVLCGVCVPGADVFVLECFELLLGAEFVRLDWEEMLAGEAQEIVIGKGYHFAFLEMFVVGGDVIREWL